MVMAGRRLTCERGTALVAAILLVVLLSATGLGLALTCSLEPVVAANFEAGLAASAVAEAAVTLVAHDLAAAADWATVPAGTWRALSLEPLGPQDPVSWTVPAATVSALTNLANCGQVTTCSAAALAAVTSERPWGTNNPVWQAVGRLRAGPDRLFEMTAPFDAVAWVGDDPAESDGDPRSDEEPDAESPALTRPGHLRLLIRAEVFGPRGAHATLEVTAARREPGGAVRLHRWRVWS